MPALGVNIDHVAALRQARGTTYPDLGRAAQEAEAGGADGITVHLREDRRHIQDADLEMLRGRLATKMNLEMAVIPEMIDIARRIAPRDCCLVPERRAELTTEGGLDVAGQRERLAEAVAELARAGIIVSLFIDPDAAQIAASVAVGAPVIELHTGAFANARGAAAREQFARIQQGVRAGRDAGLQVNAGHGLHYGNVTEIARIPGISELNIGHSIVARGVFIGLRAAVGEMKALLDGARR